MVSISSSVKRSSFEVDTDQMFKICKSRRKWNERPDDELKLKQTLNKRRKGLVSKAYQLSYLTKSKVFIFMSNQEKGESWAYASPSFEAALNGKGLQAMRRLAGLSVEGNTQILSNPDHLNKDYNEKDTPKVNKKSNVTNVQQVETQVQEEERTFCTLDRITASVETGTYGTSREDTNVNANANIAIIEEKQQEPNNENMQKIDTFLSAVFQAYPPYNTLESPDLLRSRQDGLRFYQINRIQSNSSGYNCSFDQYNLSKYYYCSYLGVSQPQMSSNHQMYYPLFASHN